MQCLGLNEARWLLPRDSIQTRGPIMKSLTVRYAIVIASAAAVGSVCWGSVASAQTVVVQPGQAAPPPAPAPVVVAPQAAPAASPVVVNNEPGPQSSAPASAESPSGVTRPNRKLLMTGLILAGAPYAASIGIGATSSHNGDSNLFVPVIGPWLDLGSRGDCPANADCGPETGNKVLLVGDGILQSVGFLEIIGAFIFPETLTTTTYTTASGASFTVTPSKVGREGYGLSAVGEF
jgi:hypothetical protein